MPSTAGDLLVIGGAEDKLGKRRVLEEFVTRAGGREARIAVIATASSLGPEIVDVYDALFTKLGAAEVFGVRPEDRAQAAVPEYVEPLRRAVLKNWPPRYLADDANAPVEPGLVSEHGAVDEADSRLPRTRVRSLLKPPPDRRRRRSPGVNA